MKFFKIVGVLAIIVIVLILSDKTTQELNLDTGMASRTRAIAGVSIEKYANIHNPELCPNWLHPKENKNEPSVSYTCYRHFMENNLLGCKKQVLQYNKAYDSGCGVITRP